MLEIPWGHIIAEGVVTLVAVGGGGLWAFNKTWGKINILLREYRLHEHPEREGPLCAENIRYPRTLNGNKP